MKITLYNTLTKNLEEFTPIENNGVRIYSCGPTVYTYAHIGNMRAFLFADLLQRVLRRVGSYTVRWVMNITNIDDKTIRDSQPNSPAWHSALGVQTGDALQDLLALTAFYEREFVSDIAALGIEAKDFYKIPRATDFIEQMQDLLRKIVGNGYGYVADGSIYFNVSEYMKKEHYGKLFHIDMAGFKTGLRIDTDQYEREQVSDFVLWKGRKEKEPYWDFDLDGTNYPGRPGWHIECSAMEECLLGLPFDIHTGGIDLKFPHHEDEIAQSKAGYGIEPTRYWCHNEFLEVEGSKMSKSAGNFWTLRQLIEQGISAIDIRYAMLAAHYRTKYNYTSNGISAAGKARQRLQDYIYAIIVDAPYADVSGEIANDKMVLLKEEVFSALANDLHTPKALAALFSFINANTADSLSVSEKKDFVRLMVDVNAVFNCWHIGMKEDSVDAIPVEVRDLAEQRLAAKQAKNYAEADRLRSEVLAMGYKIKDTKDGYEVSLSD
ncbi:MAG: cysteine--tRNA ligase [Ignavibacteria bacterium]|jgi:cysteinyl-tRNA synthetase|nr:cysteine--tRNA ligase [Ignavibacteria bacterium]